MATKEMHTVIIHIYDFTVFKPSEIGCFSRHLHFFTHFLKSDSTRNLTHFFQEYFHLKYI